jgi:hypothetical protein
MKTIANDIRLRGELSFVCELLKVAATTTTKVRARRLDPRWRGRDDLFNRGEKNVALLSLNTHTHAIAGRRK